jgi:hypothetical protein
MKNERKKERKKEREDVTIASMVDTGYKMNKFSIRDKGREMPLSISK